MNQVPPFDATLDWPKSINGVTMDQLSGVDEIGVVDHGDVPAGDFGAGGFYAERACRSVFRSSAGIATISRFFNLLTRSSKPLDSEKTPLYRGQLTSAAADGGEWNSEPPRLEPHVRHT